MPKQFTFGSLFAGIGGFDLGFERAGMTCKWQVEIDDHANRVLEKHWPDVRRHGDIKTFPPGDPDDWRVDCICGGFPCQDISYAGAGAGLAGERSGLFFDAMRVVRELEPRVVVLENVAALLTRGLDDVLGSLASLGFDAEWHCVPAAAFGAPHIRDRVFIIGHRTGMVGNTQRASENAHASQCGSRDTTGESSGEIPDTQGNGRRSRRPGGAPSVSAGKEDAAEVADSDKSKREALRRDGLGKGKPTQPPSRIGRGRNQWAIEPDVGGSVDGFPNFLDRHIGRGLSHGESQRAVEGLRNVWNEHISKAVQRSLGGLGRIQAAEVLFALMREYARGGGIPREFVAGTEALAETLRDLRGLEIARGTPRGREQEQQHAGEYPDSMRDMSQQIASWNAFESGIDRTATSIPARVDRLRGLGNAVVPQVAEWIGRRVMELLA